MSLEANKAIVKRWFEEAWQWDDPAAAVDVFFAEDYVAHALHGAPVTGRAPVVEALAQAKGSIPDIRFEVVDQVAEGDKVVSRLVATGTHLGTLAGRPATGRPIRRPGMVMFRLANGKIVESWRYWDQSYLAQLDADE